MSFPYHLLLQRPLLPPIQHYIFQLYITVDAQRLNLHFQFSFLCHLEGPSLVFNRAPGFCTSHDSFNFLHCRRSLQVKPPLVDCAYAPSFFVLCSPQALKSGAIARCGSGRCEGLSWFLSSSLLSSSSSPPPSGSSGKPRQCGAHRLSLCGTGL